MKCFCKSDKSNNNSTDTTTAKIKPSDVHAVCFGIKCECFAFMEIFPQAVTILSGLHNLKLYQVGQGVCPPFSTFPLAFRC